MAFSNESIIKFSEALDRERAIPIVEKVTSQLHINSSGPLKKDDASLFFEVLKNKGGVVTVIANFLIAETHMSH